MWPESDACLVSDFKEALTAILKRQSQHSQPARQPVRPGTAGARAGGGGSGGGGGGGGEARTPAFRWRRVAESGQRREGENVREGGGEARVEEKMGAGWEGGRQGWSWGERAGEKQSRTVQADGKEALYESPSESPP